MRQLPRRSTHLSAIQARTMTDEDMIALVQEYFAGVDNENIDRVLSTLGEWARAVSASLISRNSITSCLSCKPADSADDVDLVHSTFVRDVYQMETDTCRAKREIGPPVGRLR
jgi:hypothetical protein